MLNAVVKSRQTDTHQFYILPYKVQLVLQRYLLTAAAIKHIPQQPAQVMDSTLGPCGIKLYEGIDIVQSIEQEMRIELLPQILQFGL